MVFKTFAAVAIAIVIAVAFLILGQKVPFPTVKTQPSTNVQHGNYSWGFKDNGSDAVSGAPLTTVTLVYEGTGHMAGVFQGSCAQIGGANATALLPGEESAVQCYFAGAGDEVGIFNENGTYSLKKGEIQEPQGDGAPAFRGNFQTILTLSR